MNFPKNQNLWVVELGVQKKSESKANVLNIYLN